MSFLFAQPEMLGAAATDLASIGSAISTANAAAAAATTRVLAAGADEVSAAVAALFSGHAQTYQALSTQAAAFHQQIVQTLTSTAGAYASAEAANVEQQLLGAINAPTMALLGRPLIGHGADGAPGTGQAGGPAGSCTARRQRRAAGTPGLPSRPGAAIAAIAVQDPPQPRPACPVPRRPIGTVAERPPQQRLGGRVDRGQQLLLDLGLGGRICSSATGKRLHELLMKRRRLGAERLIGLSVAGKQRRDRRRHLIGTRGQHGGGRRSRGGIGRADRRSDTRQVCCRGHHNLRGYADKRHHTPPQPARPTTGEHARWRTTLLGESERSATRHRTRPFRQNCRPSVRYPQTETEPANCRARQWITTRARCTRTLSG